MKRKIIIFISIFCFFIIGCGSKDNKTNQDVIEGDYILIDKTKEEPNFVCAEALEGFYQDDNYYYYYSCIKSDYIIVRYKDGSEETVKEAINNGKITINDLDKFNIGYYKEEKR